MHGHLAAISTIKKQRNASCMCMSSAMHHAQVAQCKSAPCAGHATHSTCAPKKQCARHRQCKALCTRTGNAMHHAWEPWCKVHPKKSTFAWCKMHDARAMQCIVHRHGQSKAMFTGTLMQYALCKGHALHCACAKAMKCTMHEQLGAKCTVQGPCNASHTRASNATALCTATSVQCGPRSGRAMHPACTVGASPVPPSSTQHHGTPMGGSRHCTCVCMHTPAQTQVPAVAHTHTCAACHDTSTCACASMCKCTHVGNRTRCTSVHKCAHASRCIPVGVQADVQAHTCATPSLYTSSSSLHISVHVHRHVQCHTSPKHSHILEHIRVHTATHKPCTHPGAHARATPLLHISTCTCIYMHVHTCAAPEQMHTHLPACSRLCLHTYAHTNPCAQTCATPSLHK